MMAICDVSTEKWKNILRDIYDSEELKIDSERSKELKGLLDQLCTAAPEDTNLRLFQECFAAVDNDITQIKKEAKTTKEERPYFKRMFLYQAQRLSPTIQGLPENLRDPIMWQVCNT